jgi:hypothetical protein
LGNTEAGIRPAVREAARLYREVGADPRVVVCDARAQAVSDCAPDHGNDFEVVKNIEVKAACP